MKKNLIVFAGIIAFLVCVCLGLSIYDVNNNSNENTQENQSVTKEETSIKTETTKFTKDNYEAEIKNTQYENLSSFQKKTIINWIDERYDYYDKTNGGYSGDKYTETIFNEAAEKFNKTYDQIDEIWSEKYNLTYSTTKSYSYSSYSKTYSSFNNKYGTATTQCAHPGCSNYIASSGDTNCCATHSNRCAGCGCYIDEDASYCMDCIYKAYGY